MLKIDDLTKFTSFANKISNPLLTDIFDGKFQRKFLVEQSGHPPDNELGFLEFLADVSSGLKLFRGNTDFTQWTGKKTVSGTISNNPCDGLID